MNEDEIKGGSEGWKTADRWLHMKIRCAVTTAVFPSTELMSSFTPAFVWKTIQQKVTWLWSHGNTFSSFIRCLFCFSWIRFALEINSKPGKCQHEHIDCHSWTQFHRVRTENQWIELSEAQVLTFVLRSVIAGAFIDNISQ